MSTINLMAHHAGDMQKQNQLAIFRLLLKNLLSFKTATVHTVGYDFTTCFRVLQKVRFNAGDPIL